jgi:transposase InsO family protein
VHHRTDDGRAFRTLNILDEHSRECLAIRVKRKLNSTEVIDALTDLFMRNHYNTKRPHSALDYRPPAPEAIIPMDQRPIMH